MFSVRESSIEAIKQLLIQNGLDVFIEPIGRFVGKREKVIEVKM
jgi:hypothetical protein